MSRQSAIARLNRDALLYGVVYTEPGWALSKKTTTRVAPRGGQKDFKGRRTMVYRFLWCFISIATDVFGSCVYIRHAG